MSPFQVEIHTDGSCLGNPGAGGYAAIICCKGYEKVISGGEQETTNNRMELTAVIEALSSLKAPSEVIVYSDSEYVVNSITRGWKRNRNHDLWNQYDAVTGSQNIVSLRFVHEKGHAGNEYNERCDTIAKKEAFAKATYNFLCQ